MTEIQAIYECLFCPQRFDTAAAKDDHLLGHFARETCVECNRNLIRIGNSLYTKHEPSTCIKITAKLEEDFETKPIGIGSITHIYTEDAFSFPDCDVQIKTENEDDQLNNSDDLLVSSNTSQADDESINEMLCKKETEIEVSPNEQNHVEFPGKSTSMGQQNEPDKPPTRRTKGSGDIPCEDPNCTKNFLSHSTLQRHMKIVHNPNALKCKHCSAYFSKKSSLELHESRCDQLLPCDDCGKLLNQAYLRTHKIIQHSPEGTIFCKFCGKLFSNIAERDDHKIFCGVVKKGRSGDIPCEDPNCKKKFMSRSTLSKHMKIVHNPNALKCKHCSAYFAKKLSLESHESRCNGCNRLYPCDICGKLLNQAYLRTHKIIQHSPEGTIFCNLCGKLFSNIAQRDDHRIFCAVVKKSRSNGQAIECDICKKVFKRKGDIRRHMRLKHNPDVQMYKCTTCGRVFIHKSSLKEHQCKGKPRLAVQAEQMSCETCGKIVARSSMRRHQIIQHSEPGTILCCMCCRIFTTEDELNKHMVECRAKRNTKKACDICGKISANIRALSRHKTSLHSKPGTIFCRSCVKKFKTIEELNAHTLVCSYKRRKGRVNDRNC